ncbi:hypothetical protein [Halalkalicoccus sp. NIPERK01]|uniref:hypothetical protein n=1 Tax=Halalkalicoccus sp. NIPERK01 TaxID=3053469 RepID=UPI00256F5178|nr:hypothetical protein [Halalkalicoccus sp. NIPERK01]MDL5361365.1 hypothetical protein [Halalkalicoccus sp. NIPERK01]
MATAPTPVLTEYIGQRVEAEFAGRRIDGVVRDVEHRLETIHYEPQLLIARKGGATISVPPEAVVDRHDH